MRVLTLALVAACLVPSAGATAVLDAGVVAVDMDANEVEDCAVPGMPPLLCPVTWDTGGTLHPGDDAIAVRKFIDEVQFTVRPPVGEARTERFEASEIVLEHPAFRVLNATWGSLNDSRPGALQPHVTFESRPWAGDSEKWVIAAVVHLPFAIDLADYPITYLGAGVCYQGVQCNLYIYHYLAMDEDTIRPFPHNVLLSDEQDTDFIVTRRFYEAEQCFFLDRYLPEEPCAALAGLKPTFDDATALYASLTPTVSAGFQYNRTTLHLDPEGPGEALDLHAGVRGASSAAEAGVGGSAPRAAEELGVHRAEAPAASRDLAPATAPPQEGPPIDSAAVAAVAVVAPDVVPWLLGGAALLVAWLLYHRVAQQRALEQSTRQRVYRAICDEPGVRVGTLAARLGLAHNTVKHHVATLERLGFVLAHGDAQRRYFASHAASPEDRRLLAEVLGNPATRAVHEVVRDAGPLDLASLGGRLGLAPSTVSMAVGRLRRAGLLETTRVCRRIVASPGASPGATHAAAGLAAPGGR